MGEKDSASFPGLENEAMSFSDDSEREDKDFLKTKKEKEKKPKRDKGYATFKGETSEEDEDKSPSKVKRSKGSFKSFFNPSKNKGKYKLNKERDRDKEKEKEKEKDKSKDVKSKEKDGKGKAEKKEKEKEKFKKKTMNPYLQQLPPATDDPTDLVLEEAKPVFGVPLALAVERSRLYNGIPLPTIVRQTIDFVEENYLAYEGIYRISGVKSKVEALKAQYDRGESVSLEEQDPSTVTSLFKLYLRQLPQHILTNSLLSQFEEATTASDEKGKIEQLQKALAELPEENRTLLSWVVVHMSHIMEKESENKMGVQNISIVLSPTMKISHRVLNHLFKYGEELFKDTIIKKCTQPLRWQSSRSSIELPDSPGSLEEELRKQEDLLNYLHQKVQKGNADKATEEQLWEVQRIVTQLKRKIKQSKKEKETTPSKKGPAPKPPLQKPAAATAMLAEEEKITKPDKNNQNVAETTDLEEDETKVKLGSSSPVVAVDVPLESLVTSIEEEPNVSDAIETEPVIAAETVETVDKETLKEQIQVNKEENGEQSVVDIEEDLANRLIPVEAKELAKTEELIALGNELRQRIAAEHSTVEKLKEQISMIDQQQLKSSFSDSSVDLEISSNNEIEDNRDLQKELEEIYKQNKDLEENNFQLERNIITEREKCVELKVLLKIFIQQKQQDSETQFSSPSVDIETTL